MGRTVTATGIAFNLGGTALPAGNNYLEFSKGTAVPSSISFDGTTLTVFTWDKQKILIESDGGTVKLYAEEEIELDVASAGVVRFTNQGGTIAELDNSGNLNIAGNLGTGQSF